MTWPDAFAIVGGLWAVMVLPLAILWRNYKMNRAVLDFKDRHPDIDVHWRER